MELHVDLGSLIHLFLTVALAMIYAARRQVVTLPALMIASLIGVSLGLRIHPFLLGIADFAALLIVFVAGLELDPKFLREEKERMLLIFAVEAVLLLSLFYILSWFLPFYIAVAVVAIMIASNEAFTVELAKINKRIAQYGITLSVLEDALAVFLLSLGFFTRLSLVGAVEKIEFLISISLFLSIVLYVLSNPFDRYIEELQRTETRVLLSIFYMVILVVLSELLELPEVIPVFIGAVMLSLRGYDPEAHEAIRSYFVLALLGFVSSLPYMVGEKLVDPFQYLYVIAWGIGLALLAYALRFIVLFWSSIVGGLKVRDALSLALTMANTGEFGLIVLSNLIKGESIIPIEIAYAAMLAYAINLTIVSEIAKRVAQISEKVVSRIEGTKICLVLRTISREGDELVRGAAKDVDFKRGVIELATTTTLMYALTLAYKLTPIPFVKYLIVLLIFSTFLVAIQKLHARFAKDIRKFLDPGSILGVILRFMVLYLVVAPILSFLELFYREAGESQLLPLHSPLTLFLVLLLAYVITLMVDRLARILTHAQALQ